MPKKSKQKGGKRWIQELETRDSVEENEGTFSSENSAEEIAIELKRRAPNFQAAVGKITLYLNRAGKRLSESRKKELERVKVILRELFNRKDRQRANKDRPIKVDIKKASSIKYAAFWGSWYDDEGQKHIGDQFTELLSATEEQVKKVHSEISWDDLEKYRDWVLSYYFGKNNPKNLTDEEKEKLLSQARNRMMKDFWSGKEVPFWDITKSPHDVDFEIIDKKKIASREIIDESGEQQIIFANTRDAMQYLADLMGESIQVQGK